MKKILQLAIVLLAILVIAPGIAYAASIRTELNATMGLTASSAGDITLTNGGIMRQVGAEASGTIVSSDPRASGEFNIVLNVIFNTNTGEGVGFGSFTLTSGGGTFEGTFRLKDTQFIFFAGSLEGRGTDAYKGMRLHLEFDGTDFYRDDDPNTNGITATCSGYISS